MELAKNVAEKLGFEAPKEPMKPVQGGVPADHDPKDYEPVKVTQAVKEDKALSMEYTKKGDITSRVVAFLCADGVDDNSVKSVKESLMEKKAMAKIIAPHGGSIKTSGASELAVDKSFNTTGSVLFDAIYVPSGEKSIEMLMKNSEAVKFLHEAYKHCKPIAMDGAAKRLLKATYIEKLVEKINQQEEGIILKESSSGLADDFIKAIGQHRFWNREQTDLIPT